jgi:predicted MPP superfamily phosphohydrolase
MGWTLLQNEHRYIERGKSGIVIAGMENDGDGIHFPQKGDVPQTLKGVEDGTFILMLEHDPSSWRRKIIPDGRAQLTLSGHTHKMQFSIFGWCPMSIMGKEYNDWYTEGSQSLFVTAGLGGLIPFRFGSTGEIVVLTLRRGN